MNKNKPRRWIALVALSLSLTCAAAAGAPGNLHDGLSAYVRGHFEDAAALLETALAEQGWRDRAERAAALRVLASIHLMAGRDARAESRLRELLALRPAEPDPAAASDLLLLARAIRAQGRLEEAEAACLRASEHLRGYYGLDHPLVAEAFRSLAEIKHAQGDGQEAERLYWRAYMIASYVGGAESSLVGAALLGLGTLRKEQNRTGEARALLGRALRIADKPPRADGKWDRLDERDLRAALPEERESYAVRGKIYSRPAEPSRPEYAEHLEHRGRILRGLDRVDEAEEMFKHARLIRARNFGAAASG